MIWFTLALFAISFLAVALLTPQPQIEDARAQDLDPNSFPRASEDAPIPLVLGCVRQRGPNTLWYGNFRAEAQKEKVKTGLFSSKKVTTGYKYYLTFDLGICLGPAAPCGPGIAVGGGGGTLDGEDIDYGSTSVVASGTFPGGINQDPPGAEIIDLTALDFDYINSDWNIVAILTADTDGPGASVRQISVVPYFEGASLTWPDAQPTTVSDNISGEGTTTLSIQVNGGEGGNFDEIRINAEITEFIPLFSTTTVSVNTYELQGTIYGYTVTEFTLTVPGGDAGGGMILPTTWYPGTFDQNVDSCIEDSVGAGQVPAYRGTAHAVFCDAFIGESPQLKKIQFQPSSYSTNISSDDGGKLNASSVDINPAEAIYEILTNEWRGLGVDPNLIDLDNTFTDAHATLKSENHGCSIIVSSPKTGKQVLTEILRQIDGILRQNSEGIIELILIRDDYDASLLDIYDEDDIVSIENFTKTTWEDVRSQVKVSFSDRNKEEAEGRVAVAQDMAVYGMIGRLSTANISFPFCYDPVLANKLAQRELNRLSVPLFRLTAIFNRNAYKLKTGDVIKINWSEYGFSELIMRVQKMDLGLLDDNKVRVELVQDVFAVTEAVFGPPEDSLFEDDTGLAEDITVYDVTELPYIAARNLPTFIGDGDNVPLILPTPPTTNSTMYTVYIGDNTGELVIRDPGEAEYPATGTLKSAYGRLEGFATGLDSTTGFVLENLNGQDWETEWAVAEIRGLGGLLYVDGEWMAYTTASLDSGTGELTVSNIYRGLFGTVPQTHAAGTRVFQVNPEHFGDGLFGPFATDGDDVFFEMADIFGIIEPRRDNLTERTYTIQNLSNLPLRPRDITLEASRATDQEVTSATAAVAWVPSNRAENEVTFEDDGSETPDNTETYELEVWVDDAKVGALDETGITGTSTTVDLSAQFGAEAEIRVYSRRSSDSARSAGYAFIPFSLGNEILLSGDESGKLLLSGDAQSGNDGVTISET